jgi:hypothetical protein
LSRYRLGSITNAMAGLRESRYRPTSTPANTDRQLISCQQTRGDNQTHNQSDFLTLLYADPSLPTTSPPYLLISASLLCRCPLSTCSRLSALPTCLCLCSFCLPRAPAPLPVACLPVPPTRSLLSCLWRAPCVPAFRPPDPACLSLSCIAAPPRGALSRWRGSSACQRVMRSPEESSQQPSPLGAFRDLGQLWPSGLLG